MLLVRLILACVASYLLGSVPTGYWLGKIFKKIDIRQHGSGNTGATNALRVLGKRLGAAVFLIDVGKGILAPAVISDLFGLEKTSYLILLGLSVIAGHSWTIFLQFKGGKGVATSLGVFIGLAIKIPAVGFVVLICLLVWGSVFIFTGFVSLASLLTAVVLPVSLAFSTSSFELTLLGVLICFLVVLRHRSNIKRLLSGQESRISIFKKKNLKK